MPLSRSFTGNALHGGTTENADSRRGPSIIRSRNLGAEFRTPYHALLLAPAVELRVPAAAASDEPLRARNERHLLGRAGRYRAARDRFPAGPRSPRCSECPD